MKNNKIKFITVLAIILALSLSALPLTSKAVTSTSTGARKATTTKSLVKPAPKPLPGEANLRAQLKARVASANATTSRLTASSTKALKVSKTVAEALKKADTEITKRIESLNKTMEKIQAMKNVSESEKNSIKTDLQSEIDKLTALQSKIQLDTDLATIKKDLATIISGSRIYALVVPKANILASVDKINTIATMLGTISTKLQTRIDEATASGTSTNVTAMQTALSDIERYIASAKEESLTAQTVVSGLVPDNGDKTVLDSNNSKIKSAKVNIKNANKYLTDARKAASIITKGLKSPGEKDTDKATTTKAVKTKAKAPKK